MQEPLELPDGDPGNRRPPEGADRPWRHPSEVGLDQRGRRDQRRGTLVGGVLVGFGVVLLALGAALGLSGPGEGAASDPTVPVSERVRPTLAAVDVEGPAGRRTVTGIVLDGSGHVVAPAAAVDGASRVSVTCGDRPPQDAEVVAVDGSARLAVLRIPDPAGRPVTAAGPPAVGTEVVAARASAGEGPVRTVPARIAAVPASPVGVDAVADGGPASAFATAATFDADDGALFDEVGRFVGLVVSARPAGAAVGPELVQLLAVPATVVVELAHGLLRVEAESMPWLGLSGSAAASGGTTASSGGLRVTAVVPGGPAAVSGIAPGDVVVALGGRPVGSMEDLRGALRSTGIGVAVEVTLRRPSGPGSVTLVTAVRPRG
jgi:S1-C subfamily serine protease